MKEAAALNKEMYQQLVSGQGQQQQAAPSAPAPFRGPPQTDEFLHDPAGATQRYLQYVRQTELVPEFQQRDAAIGQQARAIAEMQFKDEFRRWGPEIDLVLDRTPASQRTPTNVALIVDMVRAKHLDELINEKADKRIEELVQGGTLRPQGADGGAGGNSFTRVDLEKLPSGYKTVLGRLGVTPEDVDSMLRTAFPNVPLSKARERWMEKAVKGDVITDGPNSWYHEEKLPHD